MAEYMVMRIIQGALSYTEVITKRSDLKIEIDKILTDKGHSNLIG
ncbi:MAG: hypothetical protein RSA01_00465 [Clostridium sp.]